MSTSSISDLCSMLFLKSDSLYAHGQTLVCFNNVCLIKTIIVDAEKIGTGWCLIISIVNLVLLNVVIG